MTKKIIAIFLAFLYSIVYIVVGPMLKTQNLSFDGSQLIPFVLCFVLCSVINILIFGMIPKWHFDISNECISRWKTCTNGSSEFVSNVSGNIVAMLYNFQLMRFAGEDGVAAYGVLLYANWIFIAILFGYVTGAAPVIGYHFGAQNHDELKNLFRKSMIIMGIAGAALCVLTLVFADVLSGIFVGYDPVLFEITKRAVVISAFAFIFIGFNIFASGFFTALNNGLVSAVIAFLRTVVFQVATVLILPEIWEIDGIWWSMVASELLSLMVSSGCLIKFRKKYHYM